MARIVVIDAVPDAAQLARRVLEEGGHEVCAFSEEGEALDFLRHREADLVILDLRLKQVDGVEMLREIRRCAPETKVVILTGYPTVAARKRALQLGASAFCVKPIDNEELARTVALVLTGAPPPPS